MDCFKFFEAQRLANKSCFKFQTQIMHFFSVIDIAEVTVDPHYLSSAKHDLFAKRCASKNLKQSIIENFTN
jgi:hypothetical protein